MILITPLCQHALLFCLVLNYEQRCFFWWLKQIQTWPFIYLKKITTVNFSCDNIVRRTKLPYQFVNNWERKWCARPLDVYYLLADWSLVAFRTCPWKLFIRWLFFFFFFIPIRIHAEWKVHLLQTELYITLMQLGSKHSS